MFNRNCLTTKLTMISKELLTAIRKDEHKVLNTDLNYIEKDNKIGYLLDNRQWYFINIYEFAHKCKEWAYTNKYRLSSGQHRLNTKQEHYINNQIASYFCSVYYITNDDSDIQIDANTEPEAIIKACEWLLENNK